MYSGQPYRTSTGNNPMGMGFTGANANANANRYQPSGFVQSSYGQNQGMSTSMQQGGGANYSQAQQFHGANYRGDQQGHDQDLRGDAFNSNQSAYDGRTGFVSGVNPEMVRGNPSSQFGGQQSFGQSSFGRGMSNVGMGNMGMSSVGSTSATGSAGQYGGYGQTQQFHTANYRGDQPGHDQDLRGDAFSPNQSAYNGRTGFVSGVNPEMVRGNPSSQFGGQQSFGQSSYGRGMSNVGMGNMGMSNIGSSSTMAGMGAGSNQNRQSSQYGQTQQFHTANYRGDQPGHDQDLRGDAFSPNQSAYDGRTGSMNGVNPEAARGQAFGQSW